MLWPSYLILPTSQEAPHAPWVRTEYQIGLGRYDVPRACKYFSVELVQRPLSVQRRRVDF
jgi:hypothetical protein